MATVRAVGVFGYGENYLRFGKTASGLEYKSINFSVASANNNRIFFELFGMKQSVLKLRDTDNNNIEVSWNDRNDEDIINSVSFMNRHTFNITGDYSERKVVITDYDAVEYIAEHMSDLKDQNVVVTGKTSPNVYNGSVTQRFQVQNIYLAKEDEKHNIKITSEYFFDADSINGDDFTEDKKIYVNGYISSWFSKKDLGADKGATKYVPQQIVFDLSKVDFANERQVKRTNFILSMIGISPIKSSTDKIKCKLKGWHANNLEFAYINGAEEIAFDESLLTDTQREMIEFGLKTLDDFKPSGSVYGNRVTLWKLVGINANGKYADGMIEVDDIENDIFTPAATIGSLDELDKKANAEEIDFKDKDIMEFEEIEDDEDIFS